MDQKGVTRLKLVISIVIAIIILLVGIWVINYYREKTQDAIRFADMAVIQAALNQLYTDQASYTLGETCSVGSLLREDACVQKLSEYINNPNIVRDPVDTNLLCTADNCGTRPCEYTVGQDLNKDGYRIFFHLERGIEGVGPGCHYLDPNGIH